PSRRSRPWIPAALATSIGDNAASPSGRSRTMAQIPTESLRTGAYIAGRFRDAADGATFESLAAASARAAFDAGDWSQADPADRKAVLLRLADLIEAATDELALLESVDAGR